VLALEQIAFGWNVIAERSDVAIKKAVERPTFPELLRFARNDDAAPRQMQVAQSTTGFWPPSIDSVTPVM
jgi:hypothetical protein